jgi:hypothetical protein
MANQAALVAIRLWSLLVLVPTLLSTVQDLLVQLCTFAP